VSHQLSFSFVCLRNSSALMIFNAEAASEHDMRQE
jgi:hypothetical protein